MLEHDPENRRLFDEVNELWQDTSIMSGSGLYNTDSSWNEISSKFGFEKSAGEDIKIIKKKSKNYMLAAVTFSSLVAIASFIMWLLARDYVKDLESDSVTKVITNEGEKSRILLPDSTFVVLNAGSSLEYNGFYNTKERDVELSGEAYFEVKTNPERPFNVKAEKMVVSATGTSFNVENYPGAGPVKVTLEKGEISITIRKEDPVFLKQGQQAVYSPGSNKVAVHAVSTDTYTSWKDNKLRFIDTPFKEVMEKLSRSYNVNIEITDPALLELKYTATFIDESISEVMRLLSDVSPIRYEIYFRATASDKDYINPRIVIGSKNNKNTY